jgi:hypothetical protein
VAPVGNKVRISITADEAIHACWMPAFAIISHLSGDAGLVKRSFLEGMSLLSLFLV